MTEHQPADLVEQFRGRNKAAQQVEVLAARWPDRFGTNEAIRPLASMCLPDVAATLDGRFVRVNLDGSMSNEVVTEYPGSKPNEGSYNGGRKPRRLSGRPRHRRRS